VDMAVSNAIDRVLNRIDDLQKSVDNRIDNLQKDMDTRFSTLDTRISSIDNRLVAVETKLGLVNETEKEIRSKLIDYAFRTGWAVMASMITYLFVRLQMLN
jgi:hypothetical protein